MNNRVDLRAHLALLKPNIKIDCYTSVGPRFLLGTLHICFLSLIQAEYVLLVLGWEGRNILDLWEQRNYLSQPLLALLCPCPRQTSKLR